MTIAILALLTLIEGMRRVPAGSVVLRRVLFGLWTVERPEPAERLRLLSWWSPIVTTIVLAPRQSYQKTSVTDLRARLDGRELYTPLFDLRVLGASETSEHLLADAELKLNSFVAAVARVVHLHASTLTTARDNDGRT